MKLDPINIDQPSIVSNFCDECSFDSGWTFDIPLGFDILQIKATQINSDYLNFTDYFNLSWVNQISTDSISFSEHMKHFYRDKHLSLLNKHTIDLIENGTINSETTYQTGGFIGVDEDFNFDEGVPHGSDVCQIKVLSI